MKKRRILALVTSVALGAGGFALMGTGTSGADVTEVTGSAYGVRASIGLFGGPPNVQNPTPLVTLPATGGSESATATPTLVTSFGPAIFFRSGPATVQTAGTLGPTGSVTSSTTFAPTAGTGTTPCPFAYESTFTSGSPTVTSATAAFTAADVGRTVSSGFLPATGSGEQTATILAVNSSTSVTLSAAATGSGTGYLYINRGVGSCVYASAFTASTASSTCTANEAGVSGSVHFTNGLLVTATDSDQNPTVIVPIPDDPAPNTSISGFFLLGTSTERFTIIFNEQIVNPDGSLTVNAAHTIATSGTALGDAYFGSVTCGVESVVVTTTTSPTTTSSTTTTQPTTTTSTTSTTTTLPPTTTSSTTTTQPTTTTSTTSTTTTLPPTTTSSTSTTQPTTTTSSTSTTLPPTTTSSTSTTQPTTTTSSTTTTTVPPPTTSTTSTTLPSTTTSSTIAGPSCNGLPATIIGTPGNDKLVGTEGNDVILGLGGDDSIYGLQGNDTICAGDGNDIVDARQGDDFIDGGSGMDRLIGNEGNDRVFGGPGSDRLFATYGNDLLNGGPATDYCYKGTGATTFAACEVFPQGM